MSPSSWVGRRRAALLVLGALGVLGGIISLVLNPPRGPAVTPRTYRSYTPADPRAVVAEVTPRDPREVAMRRELRAAPDRVDLAVKLARIDIQRSRTLSDPRYLGHAQATLGRWYTLASPPPDVLLMRATIRQSLHDFIGAKADLDALIAERPRDGQAQLTRAVVLTVTADYAGARQSCAAIEALVDPLITATCYAQIDGVDGPPGHVVAAIERLSKALESTPNAPESIVSWSLTARAELSIMRGDYGAATADLQRVVAIDPDDAYGRAALADVLMWTGHPADASALLAGREAIDNLLVRRAIAEHQANGPEAEKWKRAMRDRMAAAAERGDRIHMREEARFTLEVEGDAARALTIALEDWGVQKELADARLVAAAAAAKGDLAGADPVRSWVKAHGVEDVQLDKFLGAP